MAREPLWTRASEISARSKRRYDLYGWPQKGPGADEADYPPRAEWGHDLPSLLVGTSGWSYPHWVGRFYPDDTKPAGKLAHFSRRLPTVEVNSTYYRLPEARTFESWRRQSPPGFVFTIKAPGLITHEKRLVGVEEDVAVFLERARLLGEKLGCILWQFPPGFHADLPKLEALLRLLPEGGRHAVELRHRSWYERDVRALLEAHGVAWVVHDYNRKGSPMWTTAPFCYLRLHGPTGRYRGSYDVATLLQWAEQVREWLRAGRDVLVYFNNDERGHGIRNAAYLRDAVGAQAPGRHPAEERAGAEAWG